MKVAVIGAGFMGSMHARIFGSLHGTELVGIADPDLDRARAAAGNSGCAVYADYRELLDQDVDAVSICTKDDQHLEPALLAAQLGKHVFIEKPIASTLDDARTIVAAAQTAGVHLGVGFLLRFDPRYAHVKQLIEQQRLGQVIHVTAKRNSPRTEGPARYGGTLPLALHVMVHDVDMVLWLLRGRTLVSLYAQATDKLLGATGTQDSVFALLRFDDGTVVNLESAWALPAAARTRLDAQMTVLGTDGLVEVNAGESGVYFADASATDYPDLLLWPELGGSISGALRTELSAFIDDIRQHTTRVASGAEAVQALEITLAIIESYTTGRVLDLTAQPVSI